MSEAKEFLERIKWYDVLIDSKLEELASLQDVAKRITPVMKTGGGSGGTGNQDRLGDTVAKIADLQEEINRDVDIFVDMKREAAALLKKIKEPEYFKVLHKRYVLYESFERIATELNVTYRAVCYMHGRALQAFDKVLEEYNRNKRVTEACNQMADSAKVASDAINRVLAPMANKAIEESKRQKKRV